MEISEKIKVSVAVCTYNCEKYIGEQLYSILGQKCPVDEIVLGDDGSKDRTLEIAKDILEKSQVSYKILQNTPNLGYRKNFERTIASTTGEIIFLSDQDDVWKKDKVDVMLKYFLENPKCLMAFSDADVVDADLNRQKVSLWDAVSLKKDYQNFPEWKLLFLKGGYVTGAASAIRRELFEQTRPFSEICVHDAWLAMAAALQDGLVAVPEKLLMYRQHGSNQIGVSYSMRNSLQNKKKILMNLSEKQMEEHWNKKQIFEEILERFSTYICGDERFEKQINDCIEFHRSLAEMDNMSRVQRIRTILKNLKCKNYDRFAKTKGMFEGDFIYAVLHKTVR